MKIDIKKPELVCVVCIHLATDRGSGGLMWPQMKIHRRSNIFSQSQSHKT